MSKIDYQKLREIAEKTKIAGEAPVMPFDQRINALNDFMKHFSPDIALALLDERERNLQYIKSRDQENEDIALTVGKLRVELEAAENNLIDSECHVAELEEALRDKQALLEASEKRIAELEDEPVSQTYKLNELAGNSPVIPGEVLSAILKVARVRADFDDFDGDRRGIGDCLDEAEQELIVTINKYASQLAAGPIAPNDVREQTAVPPVPVIQADVAQAIEKLKWKLVECNRYNYCADAVKGVEYACHAAMLQCVEPASNHEELPLDYLQGQKDGLEWAAQLAEANHPQTGDWLYDDPLELAKAIRKGPDMPEFDGPTPGIPDGWVMVPKELTPEMMRAVQIRSELGGYATSNLSGAYNMFSEFWNVAVSAAPKVDDL
ncbi:ead/Ea22-like family protein [Escherichia coli]|uniref:ead/Ea22-like family protein n=5 Tax=Escherichia coli TaxID=562 RepID=UPI001CE0317D|nr:ead/Ea22-like family protein [Escherichia coli]